MYERALEGKEKAWGPEHTSTLSTLNNLGNLYADQEKMAEAEKMYQRALEGKDKALDARSTATPSTTRAFLYKAQSTMVETDQQRKPSTSVIP